MAKLSDEQLRALLLLARNPNGCSEALLMSHGFPTEMLEEMLKAGFVKASPPAGSECLIRHATADLLTRLQASPAVARRPAARSQTASPVPMQPGSL
jgi:hypothetical protein